MKGKYLFVLLFFISAHSVYSQKVTDAPSKADSVVINNDNTGADTILIIKEPVVIRKTVYIPEKKQVWNTKGFEVSLAGFVNFHDYFSNCPECIALNRKNIYATTPLPSIAIGANYLYRKDKLLLTIGLGFINFREKISDAASGSKYASKEIFVSASAGVPLNRKKVSFILNGEILAGKTLNGKGFRFTDTSSSHVEKYTLKDRIRPFNLLFKSGIKMIYFLDKSGYSLEPFYAVDLRSFTKPSTGLVKYRNFIGVRLSFIRFIK